MWSLKFVPTCKFKDCLKLIGDYNVWRSFRGGGVEWYGRLSSLFDVWKLKPRRLLKVSQILFWVNL